MGHVDKLSEPVLLLNVNFEPLHVCSTRRAISLILMGKAEIILNGRGVIRSASAEFDMPSVIKLGYLVRRPRPRVNLTKREILRRDHHTCQYCGRRSRFLTIDHVLPRRLGGKHEWTNVVAACPQCNRRKGGSTPDRVNMTLRHVPAQPSPSAYYRFSHHLSTHDEWEQFIQGW
jgi:5-methylcytosine-specific restriction endonuclease McrA